MPKTNDLTQKQKRSFHKIIISFLWSTALFWLPTLLFVVLANEVRSNEPLPGDVPILTAINVFTTAWLTTFFIAVTSLGSAPFVTAGVLVASATMWYLGQRKNAVFLAFAAGGTAVINVAIKLLFERERPDLWQHLVVEESFSFPSGHAMISSALALAVVILTWRTAYRWYAVTIGAVYAVLVGISRMYLGVHFPSDILAGWCVSVLWIITLHSVVTHYVRRKSQTYSEDETAFK